MKEFNITNTGVKIDVAAIEWPANATALVSLYETYKATRQASSVPHHALVCRKSKEGAEASEIRIRCEQSQVIGTSSAVSRNDIIRMKPQNAFIPHFLIFFLLPFSLARRRYRADEPSRGHGDREVQVVQGPHRYG